MSPSSHEQTFRVNDVLVVFRGQNPCPKGLFQVQINSRGRLHRRGNLGSLEDVDTAKRNYRF